MCNLCGSCTAHHYSTVVEGAGAQPGADEPVVGQPAPPAPQLQAAGEMAPPAGVDAVPPEETADDQSSPVPVPPPVVMQLDNGELAAPADTLPPVPAQPEAQPESAPGPMDVPAPAPTTAHASFTARVADGALPARLPHTSMTIRLSSAVAEVGPDAALVDIIGDEAMQEMRRRGLTDDDFAVALRVVRPHLAAVLVPELLLWLCLQYATVIMVAMLVLIHCPDPNEQREMTVIVNWPIPIRLVGSVVHVDVLRMFALVLAPRGGDGGVEDGPSTGDPSTYGEDHVTKHAIFLNVLSILLYSEIAALDDCTSWEAVMAALSPVGLRRMLCLRAMGGAMYFDPLQVLAGTGMAPLHASNGWLASVARALCVSRFTLAVGERAFISISGMSDMQAMARYLDLDGVPSMFVAFNPVFQLLVQLLSEQTVLVFNGNGHAYRFANGHAFDRFHGMASDKEAAEHAEVTDFFRGAPTLLVRWAFTTCSTSDWCGCDLLLAMARVVYFRGRRIKILQFSQTPSMALLEQDEHRAQPPCPTLLPPAVPLMHHCTSLAGIWIVQVE